MLRKKTNDNDANEALYAYIYTAVLSFFLLQLKAKLNEMKKETTKYIWSTFLEMLRDLSTQKIMIT